MDVSTYVMLGTRVRMGYSHSDYFGRDVPSTTPTIEEMAQRAYGGELSRLVQGSNVTGTVVHSHPLTAFNEGGDAEFLVGVYLAGVRGGVHAIQPFEVSLGLREEAYRLLTGIGVPVGDVSDVQCYLISDYEGDSTLDFDMRALGEW